MLNFKIFADLNKDLLEDLRKIENNSLLEVFQLSQWLEVIVNTQENLKKIKIIIIYFNQEIILVAPLCINNFYGYKELRWLSSDIFDYNNPIILKSFNYENIDFQNLWKRIIQDLSFECDLIYFNKVPEFIKFKKNPLVNFNYKYYQKSYQLNLINFEYKTFYNKNNNNKTKQTDRRKEKKLNEKNDLKFIYTEINPQNFYLIEELIFEKMNSYKEKKEKTFDGKEIALKYKKIVNSSSNDFKFNVSILKKNNIKISSILGVIYDSTYYYLMPLTYDTEFKKFSPGRFHIINLIKWALKNNIKTIDFTAGDQPYKLNWSNSSFNMYYYVRLINLRGLPKYIFLKLYFKFRKNFFFKKTFKIMKYVF